MMLIDPVRLREMSRAWSEADLDRLDSDSSQSDCLESLEAVIHEMAHVLVAREPAAALREPFRGSEVNELANSRPHPDRDELKTAAVTTLCMNRIGPTMWNDICYQTALGNLSWDFTGNCADIFEAHLKTQLAQRQANSIMRHLRSEGIFLDD